LISEAIFYKPPICESSIGYFFVLKKYLSKKTVSTSHFLSDTIYYNAERAAEEFDRFTRKLITGTSGLSS